MVKTSCAQNRGRISSERFLAASQTVHAKMGLPLPLNQHTMGGTTVRSVMPNCSCAGNHVSGVKRGNTTPNPPCLSVDVNDTGTVA